MSAEQTLRAEVRFALKRAQVSQASVAGQLKVSRKHLSQMLTGKAPLTLDWAERILGCCGCVVAVRVVESRRG